MHPTDRLADIGAPINDALRAKWTPIYVRVLAVALACGASVHLANMLGLSGAPWSHSPLLWRALDVVLIVFNLVVGAGLWFRRPWAVIAFVAGMIAFQLVPYSLFRAQFVLTPAHGQALNALLATELLMIAILVTLIGLRK